MFGKRNKIIINIPDQEKLFKTLSKHIGEVNISDKSMKIYKTIHNVMIKDQLALQ